MQIAVVTTIPYPIDEVFPAMRDKLPDMAAFMPNIDRIEIITRDDSTPGTLTLLNKWHAAATEVPAIARPFVDPKKMYWHDHATWIEAEHLCRWRLEVGFMAERIDCKGTTSYHAIAQDKTEMRINGAMNLDLKGLVPRLMIGKATSGVETFVGRLIAPNFQKTADALTAYLDDRHRTPG